MGRSFVLAALLLAACDDNSGKQTPDTQIDARPDALTNVPRATFVFSALGNSTGFLCTLDGQGPSECVPPLVVDLADGEHSFEVAAEFKTNVDETPATYSWRIDTAAPDTTLLSGPPAIDNDPSPDFTFSGADAEGAVTFECALDGGAAAACTSPFTAAVVDGNHTFTVTAIDTAGNRDATPATHDWRVSTITPDTQIVDGPAAGAVTAKAVTFAFTSPDAEATFECALDGAAFAACTSPRAFTNLADGAHEFAVRAKAVAGVDPSPAIRAWTVDAVAPPVAITASPTNPSNDPTPSFSFSSPDTTATFECQVDGVVTFTACTSPFTSPALADGTKTFRVRATDPVGNVGTPATFAWLIDTVSPTVAITSQPAVLSSDPTPTVTFTTAGAPTVTECQVDAGAFAPCSASFTSSVADGTHTITVRVRDAAGNTATATTDAFTVDTVAPTVAFTAVPAALSNDSTPTVAFTTAGAPTIVQCRADTATFVACTSPFTTGALADGSHTISVRVVDAAGNASTATTGAFTIDTAPPTVTITSQPAALSNDTTPTIAFTTAGAPTTTTCQVDGNAAAPCTSPFTTTVADGAHTIVVRVADGAGNASSDSASFTVDTAAPAVTITSQPAALSNDATPTVAFTTAGSPTTIQCQIDGGAFATCTSPFTAAALADGTHTITVRVSDGAGNTATAATNPFVIDTVAPTVTITSQPPALSNDSTPTIAFTTAGAPTTTTCQLDGGAAAACTSPFTTTVADGAHTLTLRVSDGAGNASTDSASFTVDTAGPIVTITAQPAPLSNDSTPTVAFTVSGATTIQCQIDAGAFAACTSPFTTAALADGNHTITVRASDNAGNTTTAATGPFTIDTVAPTVTITSQPASLSNDTTPTVAFTTAGAPTSTTCAVDGGAAIACTSPFTTTVGNGTHAITIRVSDGAGNSSSATTASFTVDTVAPVVTFDDQPPAQWPVDYYTMRFRASETATFECSLNNAAFSACASPLAVLTAYNTPSTFRVRATDPAGNVGAIATSSWTSSDGLVLHYTWEQGSTQNSSLLAQSPPFSPDGNPATVASVVGGWAGTALGSTVSAQTYAGTDRPLSSAAVKGTYTASFWVRATDAAQSAQIVSTLSPTGGFRVTLASTQLRVEVREPNGSTFEGIAALALNRWVHVGLRATGPGKGLQIWIDGQLRTTVATPTATGFDAGQSSTMTVGGWSGFDVDDLRFYNKAFADAEMCTVVARGTFIPGGPCVPLSPGFELDMEKGRVADTGIWRLPLAPPQATEFLQLRTGDALRLPFAFEWGYTQGFSSQVTAAAGHSFSFWFDARLSSVGRLIDFTRSCSAAGGPEQCGMSIFFLDNGTLQVFAGAPPNVSKTVQIPVPVGAVDSVVVTEQRAGGLTQSITVFVNGKPTVIPFGNGNVFAIVNDQVRLAQPAGSVVDEYEFWPTDLTADDELLCEVGFDGRFDPANGTCSLTSN